MELVRKTIYIYHTIINIRIGDNLMTVNLSALWDFITEITDHTDAIIAVIVLTVVIVVVKRFGKGLGSMLSIGGK